MKRLLTFTLTMLTLLCLTACSMPLKSVTSRKNGLNCAFQAKANITLDKLQAEGTVKRLGTGVWEIEFSAPDSLSGVKLEFSEGNTKASYKGLSFSVPQSAVPVKAMLLNLMKAVDENAANEELKGDEKDDLLEVSGKLEVGEYILIIDKEGKLSGFEMPNNSLKMSFTELTVINGETADTTQPVTTEQAAVTETASVTTTDKAA